MGPGEEEDFEVDDLGEEPVPLPYRNERGDEDRFPEMPYVDDFYF